MLTSVVLRTGTNVCVDVLLPAQVLQRTRRVRVAGRLFVGFGERTWLADGAIFLDAARVLREAGAAALVAAFTRFFGTLSSSFSLSPSSEGRFLPRTVAFGAGFAATGAGFAGAALVLRAAGCVAVRVGTGASTAFGAASLLRGEDFATFAELLADGSSSSTRVMVRLLLGMRLTRRSRRDRRLAT